MANIINSNINSGLLKFTFTDNDGDVVASFRMNPTDIRLVTRLEEISKKFEELQKNAPEQATVQDIIKYNEEIENLFVYLLGYDARESLFGLISATTIMNDGEIFALKVIERINHAIKPEIEKRRQKFVKTSAKYAGKYRK